MKNKSLINYKLFQSRKKFNPISLFYKKQDLNYKEFVEFLKSKMVDTPGIEYFERVKQEFLKLSNESKEVIEVKQEVVEVKQEVVEEIKKIETSRQKRRPKRDKKTNHSSKKDDSVVDVLVSIEDVIKDKENANK